MKTDLNTNPLDLLREELDNDDTQIKVNAIHRLPIVMGVMNQDKIISDLIPFIKGILTGWKSNRKAKKTGEYSSLVYVFKVGKNS